MTVRISPMAPATCLLVAALAFGATGAMAQTPPAAPAAAASAAAPTEAEMSAYEAAGQQAATIWLTQLDNAMWGETWDQASRLFKRNVTLSTWMDNMPKDRAGLGRATDRRITDTIVNTSMAGQPDGIYVSVLFLSTFAGKEPIEEIVSTMREADGRFRVTGYSKR